MRTLAGIIRTVYLGIFKDVFRHIEHIQGLLRRMEPQSDIFGPLRNACIYNCVILRTLAYLEPKASSKARQTCKMIMHIRSSEQFIQVFSRIFRHIQGSWCIFSHTHRRATRQQEGEERHLVLFLKTAKSVLNFEKKTLIVSIFGLNFPFKTSFKCI